MLPTPLASRPMEPRPAERARRLPASAPPCGGALTSVPGGAADHLAARRRARPLVRGDPGARGSARCVARPRRRRRQATPARVLPVGVRRRRWRRRGSPRGRRGRRPRAAPHVRARARRRDGQRRPRGAAVRRCTRSDRRRTRTAGGGARPAGSARASRSWSATSRSCTPTCLFAAAPSAARPVYDELRSSSASASTSTSPPPPRAAGIAPGPTGSSGTRAASTRSSGLCTWARRSPAGSTTSPDRSAPTGSRSGRAFQLRDDLRRCSATPSSPASRSATTSARARSHRSWRRWPPIRVRRRARPPHDRPARFRPARFRPTRRGRAGAGPRSVGGHRRGRRGRADHRAARRRGLDALAAAPSPATPPPRSPTSPGSSRGAIGEPIGEDDGGAERGPGAPASLGSRSGELLRTRSRSPRSRSATDPRWPSTASRSRSRSGEVFGLLGPNGAGKTTTVEILEGYRRADAGEVRVLGVDPWRDGGELRPRIGVMLQEGGLYPGVRPLEALQLFAVLLRRPRRPGAPAPARRPRRLAASTLVRRMSGGQQQRLSLGARARSASRRLVFLDEPTAGWTPHARATTWTLIRELRDRGVTVVLTTHAMDEAEHLCDRVGIIDHGRLVACGTPNELTAGAVGRRDARSPPCRTRRSTTLAARSGRRRRGARARPGEYLVDTAVTPRSSPT